ncbi:hypothetical protein BVRB_7g174760 [Beta vulgaris subsp. vulgaris]|nr:hypothetical protein BVRB_7g174760 [Beta vulgaris subsp. vulgaris]
MSVYMVLKLYLVVVVVVVVARKDGHCNGANTGNSCEL